jgi:hypothetical protein
MILTFSSLWTPSSRLFYYCQQMTRGRRNPLVHGRSFELRLPSSIHSAETASPPRAGRGFCPVEFWGLYYSALVQELLHRGPGHHSHISCMRPLRPARRRFPKSALHPHLGARSALRPRPPPRPQPTLRPAQRDGARPKSARLPAADSPPASAVLSTRKCPRDAKGGCIPVSHKKTIVTMVGTKRMSLTQEYDMGPGHQEEERKGPGHQEEERKGPGHQEEERKGPGHQEEERKRDWTLRSASMAFCTCRARASSRVRARTCSRPPHQSSPP